MSARCSSRPRLTVDGGRFDYCAKQLGLTVFDTFDVGSPFDFQNQARLYIPSHLPEPSPANREAWGFDEHR